MIANDASPYVLFAATTNDEAENPDVPLFTVTTTLLLASVKLALAACVMDKVAVPTPLIRTSEASNIETTAILLLVKVNTRPPEVSVLVVVGTGRKDGLPYAFVMGAIVIMGVAGETTSVAEIFNSPRLAVAACVAVMVVEPAPTMLTVRLLSPDSVATDGLLLANVNPTVLSVVSGSVRLNDASPYVFEGTLKLLRDADTTKDAVTLPVV